MSECEITQILDEEIHLISGSIAELGPNAARFTWFNAMDAAARWGADIGLDPDDARDHFRAYGAWEDEEIAEWTDQELAALVIQEAAASLCEQEAGGDDSRVWVENERAWIYLGD